MEQAEGGPRGGGAGRELAIVVGDDEAGERADRLLAAALGLPRAQIRRWIDAGRVRRNGDPCRAAERPRPGDLLVAAPPDPVRPALEPEPIPLRVLFEDSEILVVDKPAGMVVHPGPGHARGTLVHALLHHCGADLPGIGGTLRPGIVHRLDRGTSGVLVVARTERAQWHLAEQFRGHAIERVYRALVRGVPRSEGGRVDRPVGRHPRDRKRMSVETRRGRPAATAWRVLERFPRAGLAWLEVRPETGRTHQIRVHLASAGLPLVGDPVYGRRRGGSHGLVRPALHAARLGFTHPGTGRAVCFDAPLPEDLAGLLAQLRRAEPGGAPGAGSAR